jgi:hypothetical protein
MPNPFTFTVPAGTILALSQVEADSKAFALACKNAERDLLCLNDLTGAFCCLNSFAAFGLEATGEALETTWAVTGGSLPTGLTLVPDPLDPLAASIAGTPTQTGVFNFTIQLTGDTHGSVSKSYSITVAGITPSSLPGATFAVPYNVSLIASGLTAPFTWNLVGLLPPGLSLDLSTAIISGTPQQIGSSQFTVQVTDANGKSCSQLFTIVVVNGNFPNVGGWTVQSQNTGGNGASSSGAGGGPSGSARAEAHWLAQYGAAHSTANIALRGSVTMTKTAGCKFTVNYSLQFSPVVASQGSLATCDVTKNGGSIIGTRTALPNQSGTLGPFTLNYVPGDVIAITLSVNSDVVGSPFDLLVTGSLSCQSDS